MRSVQFPPEALLYLFHERKVMTKADVLAATGCKTTTLMKILCDYGYFTSYNFNSRYYTLRDIPSFDELGLWSYRDVRFSEWGTLSQTIRQMVQSSEAGYVATELRDRLGVQVSPELSRLHGLGRLDREKMGGRYLYVASDEQVRQAQIEARRQKDQRELEEMGLPIPEVTIAVLVEMIKDADVAPRALARRLKRRKVPVTEGDVRRIIMGYGLKEKGGL